MLTTLLLPVERGLLLAAFHHPSTHLLKKMKPLNRSLPRSKPPNIKKKNNVYARHPLVSRHQQPGESVTEYAQTLKALAKECIFGAVTADKYRAELTRDAFINGLSSPFIRQKILEKDELTLVQAVELAHGLDQGFPTFL